MFVKFAEHRHGFDFDDAASKVSVMQSKDGERVRVISGASVTSASWLSRTESDKTENDKTRDIFRKAIIEMFGGEDAIPPAVKGITANSSMMKLLEGMCKLQKALQDVCFDSEVSELFYATDRFAMDELDRVKMRS